MAEGISRARIGSGIRRNGFGDRASGISGEVDNAQLGRRGGALRGMRKLDGLCWDGALFAAGVALSPGGWSVVVSSTTLSGLTTGTMVVHSFDIDRRGRRLRRYRALFTDCGVGGERRQNQKVKESTATTKTAPPRAMPKIEETGRFLVVLEDCAIRVSLGEIVLLGATPDESVVELGM